MNAAAEAALVFSLRATAPPPGTTIFFGGIGFENFEELLIRNEAEL